MEGGPWSSDLLDVSALAIIGAAARVKNAGQAMRLTAC